jgi:transposase
LTFAEHDFCAVDPNRFDLESNFLSSKLAEGNVLKLEDIRPAGAVKTYLNWHSALDSFGLAIGGSTGCFVLCVDEKSQIQALDRTQPGLPMKKGRCGTMTHDYKRNGTTCLFAALNVLEGTVIGSCYPQHRNEEFLKFLRQIDRATAADLDLHLVLDNYETHNHENVRLWLKKHPRFHLHFTPTSSSWLNQVERWFGEITRKRIRRGVFKSVPELVNAIDDFIKVNNQNPRPFVWAKTTETILEKIARCKEATVTLH